VHVYFLCCGCVYCISVPSQCNSVVLLISQLLLQFAWDKVNFTAAFSRMCVHSVHNSHGCVQGSISCFLTVLAAGRPAAGAATAMLQCTNGMLFLSG
jgi:hypothetical protein